MDKEQMSDRERVIIHQYDKSERFLNKEFTDTIDWKDVKNHPLDDKFFPTLVYMRDVEAFTDIYYQQLIKTPTGRDPIIRRFMDRWWEEEKLHADLIDRFLGEAGFPTEERWYEKARQQIPKRYHVSSRITKMMANMIGKRFSAVHMTWGAINELSTLQGYKRLWEGAQHPVLEHMLKGIAKEESSHIFFYHSIAKVKLMRSKYSQRMARFMVDKFWTPVGQGLKKVEDTNDAIRTLFEGVEGLDAVKKNINGAINKLPGFKTSTVIQDRIEKAIAEGKKASAEA